MVMAFAIRVLQHPMLLPKNYKTAPTRRPAFTRRGYAMEPMTVGTIPTSRIVLQ